MQCYLVLFLIRVAVVLKVNVWGPSDLKYLVDAMKSFIPNAAMVHTRSFGPMLSSDTASMPDSSQFQESIVLIDDEVVKISAILLRPSCSDGSPHLNEEPVMQNPSERGLDERMDPNGKAGSIMKPGDMSVIYVCELPEIKGKFDPDKAMSLGLKPGPKYRELQLGNSVKSDRQNIMVGSRRDALNIDYEALACALLFLKSVMWSRF